MNKCLHTDCDKVTKIKGFCVKHYKNFHYLNNKEHYIKLSNEWKINNIEKRKEIARNWVRNNKDKVRVYYQNNKIKWQLRNKTEARKIYNANYSKQRKQKDPIFKAICNLRKRNWEIIKSKKFCKNSSMKNILCCSIAEFKNHLEKHFQSGMTWDNYGIWHIDHIIPISSSMTIEEVNILSHHTNLRPLWGKDNINKIKNDLQYIKEKKNEKNF